MEKQEGKDMHKKIMFFAGIGGAVLMILGCFLPMYEVQFLGFGRSVSYIQGDGVFVIILAILTIVLLLYKKYRITIVPVAITAILIFFSLFQLQSAGNLSSLYHFGAGLYCMIIALIAQIVSVVEAFRGKWDRTGKKSNIIAVSMIAGAVVLAILVSIAGIFLKQAKNYEDAITAMGQGKYEEAAKQLRELGSYRDSEDKLIECNYLRAGQLLSKNSFDAARELYGKLNDYGDSKQMLMKCDYEEIMYDYSLAIFPDRKEYIERLTALKDYPEAEEQCKQMVTDELQSCNDVDSALDFLNSIRNMVDVKTELAEYRQKKEEEKLREQEQQEQLANIFGTGDEYLSETDDTDTDMDYDTEGTDYILPDSGDRKLKKKEILALSLEERRLARNEIYARHGRMFDDKSLQKYFEKQSWYTPLYSPEEFNEGVLSKVEKYNLRLIRKFE